MGIWEDEGQVSVGDWTPGWQGKVKGQNTRLYKRGGDEWTSSKLWKKFRKRVEASTAKREGSKCSEGRSGQEQLVV